MNLANEMICQPENQRKAKRKKKNTKRLQIKFETKKHIRQRKKKQ